jgi:hypothetical protein
MPGGKLAGLLQRVVGGGPRDEGQLQAFTKDKYLFPKAAAVRKQTASRQNCSSTLRSTTESAQHDAATNRGRKRRRSKQAPAKQKRIRREAGPTSKAATEPVPGGVAAAAQALIAETELSAVERLELFAGR